MSKNDDEVLVRVEGVSKKFCRSLKKSLWYGVCDIASELNPFGRTAAFANPHKNLTTEDTTERLGRGEEEQTKFGPKGEGVGTTESKSTEGNTGVNQRPDSAEFLEGHSQAGLQMDSEKLASIRSANDSRASGDQTGSSAESVLIRDISGKKSSSEPATRHQSLATRYSAEGAAVNATNHTLPVTSSLFSHVHTRYSPPVTCYSLFGRRSPCPSGRRFEEVLSVAEEVALVWGL